MVKTNKKYIYISLVGLVFVVLLFSVVKRPQKWFSDVRIGESVQKAISPVKTVGMAHGDTIEPDHEVYKRSKKTRVNDDLTVETIVNFYASKDAISHATGYSTVAHRFLDITDKSIDPDLYHFLDYVLIGEAKRQLEINCPAYDNILRGNYSSRKKEIEDVFIILKTIDSLFRSNISIITTEDYERNYGNRNIEDIGYRLISSDMINDEIIIKKENRNIEAFIDPDLISRDVINDETRNLGFTYKKNLFYDDGIRTKELDCDNMVVNYLAVGEVMRLPVHYVPGIGHAYLKWKLSDGSYISYETTSGRLKQESAYVKTNIHKSLKDEGYFFNPLEREEAEGEAYYLRGCGYFKSGEYFKALRDFCKSIQLNSKNTIAYKGASISFKKLSYDTEANILNKEAKERSINLFYTAVELKSE